MSKPQQPEIARSGRSPVDPSSVKAGLGGGGPAEGPTGPIPEANRPGHHPDQEQDKPTIPPPRPSVSRTPSDDPSGEPSRRWRFAFEPRFAAALRLVRVTPDTAWVSLEHDTLTVRFGPWHIRTALRNVSDARVTGPYRWWKVLGSPRLSLPGLGLTLATNAEAGVRITFAESVPGGTPWKGLRHPSVVVTVEEPRALAEALGLERARTA